jgi:hypothetical protein
MYNAEKCVCVKEYNKKNLNIGDIFYYDMLLDGGFIILDIKFKKPIMMIDYNYFSLYFKDLQEFREEKIKEILNG